MVCVWFGCFLCVYTSAISCALVGAGGVELLYLFDRCLCGEFVVSGAGICAGLWLFFVGGGDREKGCELKDQIRRIFKIRRIYTSQIVSLFINK